MADPLLNPDSGDNIGAASDRGSPPRAPRWVKVFVTVVIAVVLLIVVVVVVGGHGPGGHTSDGTSGHAPVEGRH